MIESKELCRITGAAITVIQVSCLVVAIYKGVNPIEYAYGFSLWGAVLSIPFYKST